MATLAGVAVSPATECLTDTFSLTGPAGSVPPVICGTNSGEHGNISKITYLQKIFIMIEQFATFVKEFP